MAMANIMLSFEDRLMSILIIGVTHLASNVIACIFHGGQVYEEGFLRSD